MCGNANTQGGGDFRRGMGAAQRLLRAVRAAHRHIAGNWPVRLFISKFMSVNFAYSAHCFAIVWHYCDKLQDRSGCMSGLYRSTSLHIRKRTCIDTHQSIAFHIPCNFIIYLSKYSGQCVRAPGSERRSIPVEGDARVAFNAED